MSEPTVLCDVRDRIATVTLNRPAVHNAFDDALIAELTALLRRLDTDANVRAVVLAAAGKSFSAGADLGWMKRMARFGETENRRDAMALAELLRTLDTLGKPTVARVHGAAYGGGVGLVACCDVAVAADGASFAFTEARLGLAPAVIAPYAVRAIGARAARRYFLTAERFSAAEAHALGLVHEVVPDAELDATVAQILAQVLACGPAALAACKALVAAVACRPIDGTLIEDTARRIAALRSSPEGQEGIHAFLEKRAPSWP